MIPLLTQVPRIACINDLSGFGRCSLTTAIAVLSACGVQACPLPTAILSKHTGFPEFAFTDFTPHMAAYLDDWEALSFDGIYTGFLGSAEQIALVEAFIRRHKASPAATRVLIDTVMGDSGQIYPTYTPQMCSRMKALVSLADIITPNVTEACLLTDTPYHGEALRTQEAKTLALRLMDLGCGSVVITGIARGDILCNLVLDRGEVFFEVEHRTERFFSGTGDLFASIVAAKLSTGTALADAVSQAGSFIAHATQYTLDQDAPQMEGVRFEPLLHRLMPGAQQKGR